MMLSLCWNVLPGGIAGYFWGVRGMCKGREEELLTLLDAGMGTTLELAG